MIPVDSVPAVLGVATRRERRLVLPGQFGDFLEAHPRAVFVCYGAAELFRTLEVHLVRAGRKSALTLLWTVAHQGGGGLPRPLRDRPDARGRRPDRAAGRRPVGTRLPGG